MTSADRVCMQSTALNRQLVPEKNTRLSSLGIQWGEGDHKTKAADRCHDQGGSNSSSTSPSAHPVSRHSVSYAPILDKPAISHSRQGQNQPNTKDSSCQSVFRAPVASLFDILLDRCVRPGS